MFVIIRADEKEMTFVSTADTSEEANEVIYNELLEIYGGDTDRMNDDIEDNETEICDSDMFAWSNRNGNHVIKAFWV